MKIEISKDNKNNQQGITLILSVVLLASVTFISFALSAVILREITVSRSILKTEPAISAASAGGELALFDYLRSRGSVDSDETELPGGGASYDIDTQFYDFPLNFSLSPSDGNPEGNNLYNYNYYLYDPADFENDRNLYGRLEIGSSPSSQLIMYYIYSFSNLESPYDFGFISNGQVRSDIYLNRADDRYLIELKSGNYPISGWLKVYDEAGEPKGVPAEVPSLEVTGTNDEVLRKIRIEVK